MNVYFCDVCGVRVTDIDLHSGHGMRRRNDVICAACLELGHGKGLFAQDGQKQAVLSAHESAASNGKHAPSVAAAAPPAAGRAAAADLLSEARDRARTADEDQPPSPVRPVSLLPAPPLGLEGSEVDAAAETEPPPEMTPEFEDTAKVPVVHQELSAAAAGFAALNPPAAKSSDTSAEDVVEVPPSRLDDSGSAAVVSLKDDDGDAEKAVTAISSKVDADGTGKSSQAAARRATSSSRVSKQAKSRSQRRVKPNNNQMLIVLSAMASLAIIIFGIALLRNANSSQHKGGEKISYNADEPLKQAISDASAAVDAAQTSQDAAKARHAIDLINAVREQTDKFERIAKANGWTDDQVDDKVAQDGVQQVLGMRKLLEDIIVKSGQNSSP
jgi:hypothetical protein